MRALAASLAMLAVAMPALAQQTKDGPVVPDSVRIATLTLKTSLRNLVVSQEIYFSDSTRYARSMAELGDRFTATAGVTLVVITGSKLFHSGVAVDRRAPGLVCAVFVGAAPPPFGKGEDGEPVCRTREP